MTQKIVINKVLDKIFKKLLIANFGHQEIKSFISLREQFRTFDFFIVYLSLIGHKTHDEMNFKMAASISDYLDYLVQKHQLEKLHIDVLKRNDILSNAEIFLLGARGYEGFLKFYFDDENNLYLCIDNIEHEVYKNIFNIPFLMHKIDLWLNKQNAKILNRQFNKILIFKKSQQQNIFLGFYRFLKISHFYTDYRQCLSFILINEDAEEDLTLIQEYENINARNHDTSLLVLKTKLQEIIMRLRSETYYFLNLINLATGHNFMLHSVIQHCLNCKSFDLLSEINEQFPITAEFELSLSNLIPKKALINEYYLSLIANTYDVLYGAQITADFQHNVFMCINESQLQNEQSEFVDVRFVKSYSNNFFDLELNKKIFMTTKTDTMIYLFLKQNNHQYLFLGCYKVGQVVTGVDLQNQTTPIFKLRKANNEELRRHLIYNKTNQISNAYKNAFLNINKKLQVTHEIQWANKQTIAEVKSCLQTEAQANSALYKYNWVLRKILTTKPVDTNDKYWQAYINFEMRISFNLIRILQYDFEYLCTQQIMEPATIAYQMTKRNWAHKELFQIAYMDYYLSKQQKYGICLELIQAAKAKKKSNI